MKKRMIAAAAAAIMALPLTVNAASSNAVETKLQTESAYAALQVGKKIFVHNEQSQLFQTNGKFHDGDLVDLFVLPYGEEQIPFILVNTDNSGSYNVFSDLWPEFAQGKEGDTIEGYYSGRVFDRTLTKLWSKTKHHYAEMQGDEAVAFTANDFSDIAKGYHESIRVKGKLRGLILYDCCPYLVIEDDNKQLAVFHAGMTGAELAGTIELQH